MTKTLLLALSLVPTLLIAQLPPRVLGPGQAPPTTVDPKDAASITGRAINAVTSTPLRNTSIRLINAVLAGNNTVPIFTTNTDDEGKFAMKDIPPGEYRLTAQRSGFLTGAYGARRPGGAGAGITLSAKQSLANLTIQMYPTGAVAGRVADEFGEPVEQVRIEALRYAYSSVTGQRDLATVGLATTNDLGEYRISGLTAGRYYFRATPASILSGGLDRSADDRSREVYMPVFYPGVADAAIATTTDLGPGAQRPGIDFRLRKEPAFRLSAKVSNMPVGARLAASVRPRSGPLNFGTNRSAAVGPNGQIDMDGFRPGSYVLSIQSRTPEGSLNGNLDFYIGDKDAKDLSVTLAPGVDVPGRLIMDTDTPIDFANMQITMRNAINQNLSMTVTQVNKDGSFVFKGAPREPLIFKMQQLPEDVYSISMRIGDQEVNDSLIMDLTNGVPGPVTVHLRGKAPRVEGTVVDKEGKPVAGATVVMVPNKTSQRGTYNFYMNERTNQRGQFAIRWLWPGDYRLYAWEDIEAGAWMDEELLRPSLSKSKLISLKEGDKEQVQIEVIPADQ